MKLSEIVELQINEHLKNAGRNAEQWQHEIKFFMQKIQADLDTAHAEGDERTLKYLNDRVVGQLARSSLKVIHQQRMYIREIVMTAARVAIFLK